MSTSAPDNPTPRRFRIALSFPDEHRVFVEQVAEHLAAAVGQDRILYYKLYEAEFARPNLDIHLQRLYHDQSDLIAVFLSADYERKEWCGLEWGAIRDLIKRRQDSSVMLLRFDNTEISGLFSTAGYIWIGDRSPEEIAFRIVERWRLNVGQPAALAPLSPSVSSPETPIEPKWTDELRIYGESFVGRQEELAALDRAWAEGIRIFALHADGGAGKTRVVVEWLRRMRDDGWRGARKVFVHSFYSQGSDERRNASSELFFEQALIYFGHRGELITQADERGRMLARLLVEQHGLLVLDGLEPLQHPTLHAERGRLKDPGIARLLLSLANAPHDETCGLCLITSRQPVVELQERTGVTVVQQSLDHLHRDDGAELLRQFQVLGPEEELRQASDEFHGHAYSLMLLGSFLKNATDHHDIRRRSDVVLLEEDTEHRSHARKMFSAYVRHLGENSSEVAVLRLLGFFDRAAERELLDVLRVREAVIYEWAEDAEPADKCPQPKRIEDSLAELTAPLLDLPHAQWVRVLNRLRDLRLIDFIGSNAPPVVDAHPLLRECFAEQVQMQRPVAWRAGHRRLFEHLNGNAPYWPEGIENLQPLYQAVAHGCMAGLHEQARASVYRDRILRGTGANGNYSTFKLGAIGADLGAVACFFTTPWTVLSSNLSSVARGWLLNETAFSLGALGRLAEAVEPMRLSLEMQIGNETWNGAARAANNLSELELTLGAVDAAIAAGKQSVKYADRTEDAGLQRISRTTLADALHQAGRRDEARRLFEDAEARKDADEQKYHRLYSLQGFQYCELLLSEAERAAWQHCLGVETTASTAACDAVADRVSEALRITYGSRKLLEIGLQHLTLARVLLYKAHSQFTTSQGARDHVIAAVDNLRAAAITEFFIRGLLTRAWMRCLTGDKPGCRADLEEAWEIAERGPMPLFQSDIQLYRARLFRDRTALAEARRLIEKHGYHRRDEELTDATEAAKNW